MGKHKEKSDFNEIVRSHVGRYVYNLQNPISRNAFNGKGGQMWTAKQKDDICVKWNRKRNRFVVALT